MTVKTASTADELLFLTDVTYRNSLYQHVAGSASRPSSRIVVSAFLKYAKAETPCFVDFTSKKQLSTVFPRSPSTGSQKKALAKASAIFN